MVLTHKTNRSRRGKRTSSKRCFSAVTFPALTLLLVGVLACGQDPTPERSAADATTTAAGGETPADGAAAPVFDAARAYRLLERQVAFGPRVPGSRGHEQQLDWMHEYLAARADTVIMQSFTHAMPEADTLQLTNVLARFQPDAADRLLFVAHWDTRPTADAESDAELRAQPIPGANDGASGTAVLLELANVLSSHSAPLGVDLLLVDGEDYAPGHMYLGSTYYAANMSAGARPLYAVVVDMVGDADPVFLREGYSREFAPALVERVWRLAERLGYGHIFQDAEGGSIRDDHVPLGRAGIRAIDIIDFEYGPGNRYWHTLEDTLEHTSPEGPGAVGTVLTHLIYGGG